MHFDLPLAGVVVLAMSAGMAQAEVSPWWLGLSQSITHDSNFTRVADGAPASASTINTTSLLGGFDQMIGRQHLFGTANVQANRYSGFSSFDNTGYSLRLGADWSTAERISGTVSANLNNSLARFNPGDGPSTVRRNLARTNLYDATLRVGVVTPLTLEAGFSRNELDYSASEDHALAFTQNTVRAGATYRLGADLSLGAAVRRSSGRYPHYLALAGGGYEADKLDRTDADLSTSLQASGASILNARLSYTRTHRDLSAAQDVQGFTGALGWTWRPTGKITLNTDLVRDRGVDSYFFLLGRSINGTVLGQGDNSRLTTRLALRTSYQATGKLLFEGQFGLSERSLRNSAATIVEYSDQTGTIGFNASWQALRSLQLGCNVYREERRGGGTLSLPYGVNTAGCSAQFVIQ